MSWSLANPPANAIDVRIDGLWPETTDASLRMMAAPFGQVISAKIVSKRRTCTGQGYICMSNMEYGTLYLQIDILWLQLRNKNSDSLSSDGLGYTVRLDCSNCQGDDGTPVQSHSRSPS